MLSPATGRPIDQYYCLRCKDGDMLFGNLCYIISNVCVNNSFPYSLNWALDYNGCLPTPIAYVAHCAFYTPTGTCLFCESDYTLNGNVCVLRTNPVATANCLYYSGNTCVFCEVDYYLKTDNTCDNTPIPDCAFFETVKYRCAKCDDTFQV